ncbi:MAG: DUF2723 domain-containing protein [Thermoanaerobaculia bacterium]
MSPAARAGALVFVVLALVDLATVERGPGRGDVAKFQFAGPMAATPHPTGYPLYLLLTRALTAPVPARLWPLATNAGSAILVAAALAVGAATAVEIAGASVGAAAMAAIGVGLLPPFWRAARVAEVVPLHLLFSAVVLALALGSAADAGARRASTGLAVWGLSFAHHATTVLLAPSLVALHFATPPARRLALPRLAAALAGGGALALALAGVLVARTWQAHPFYLEARADTLGDLLSVLSGARFQGWLLRGGLTGVGRHAAAMAEESWGFLPLVVAAALGWRRLGAAQRRAIGLFALGGIGFSLVYEVPDAATYLLAPLAGLLIPAAAAATRAAAAIARRGPTARAGALVAVGLAYGGEAAIAARTIDFADERRAVERLERRLAEIPPGALLLSFDYGECMTLELERARGAAPRDSRALCLHPAAAASAHGLDPLRRYLAGERLRLPPDDAVLPAGREVWLVSPETAPLPGLARRGLAVAASAPSGSSRLALGPGQVRPELARLVHQLASVPSPEELGAALAAEEPDTAFVVGGVEARRAGGAGDRLEPVSEADDRLAFEVSCASGCWLVVGERWFGRWRIELDGRRAAGFDADGQDLGLEIPPGAHRVELARDLRPFALERWWTLASGRRGMP